MGGRSYGLCMDALRTATNATKGIVTLFLLLALEGIELFAIYDFTEPQEDWLTRVVAALGALYIYATRKDSEARDPLYDLGDDEPQAPKFLKP